MSTDTVHPATAGEEATSSFTNASGETMVKRKVCIYFGYVGERYCGLQYVKEDHINTVERELLAAIHKAGFLSDCNYACENPMQKMGWERASRTDKGVHALKNLISVKLTVPLKATETNDFTGCVAALNAALPKDIRVYKIQPVTGSFNAYMFCIGRRYQYYLPTFALCSKAEYDKFLPYEVAPQHIVDEEVLSPEELAKVNALAATDAEPSLVGEKRQRNEEEPSEAVQSPTSPDGDTTAAASSPKQSRRVNNDIKYGTEPMNVFKTIPEEYMRQLAQYRISKENLERARSLFGAYVGTKPYHNFTPGGKASDKSTIRYIQRITVNDPEVLMPSLSEGQEDAVKAQHLADCYPQGLEWVRIEIEGQSFMLNQIRKMVGNVICAMVLGLPDYFLGDCLQTNVIKGIPMAPANGLFLSYLDFSIYNKRLDKMKEQPGLTLHRKMYVDMDYEVNPVDEGLKASDAAHYEQLLAEQRTTVDEVKAMHRQILATVGRRECCEDITGRWLRSCRHVSRLCFRMDFGPNDDPLRYEKAPAPIATRTNPAKASRTEANNTPTPDVEGSTAAAAATE